MSIYVFRLIAVFFCELELNSKVVIEGLVPRKWFLNLE